MSTMSFYLFHPFTCCVANISHYPSLGYVLVFTSTSSNAPEPVELPLSTWVRLLQTRKDFPQASHKPKYSTSAVSRMRSCAYTRPKDDPKTVSIKTSSMTCRRTCWASTTSSEHKTHQQSKHEAFCLLSFFLNQHRNLHPNPTRPNGKINQKLKPDVPQNPLSNHAFQQIAKIQNRSEKCSRIPVSSSLYCILGPCSWL